MVDESDGVEETFDVALRAALTVAAQLAEKIARAREQAARQAQNASESEAAELASRLQAERAVAASVAPQVSQEDWWKTAAPNDIADAWERTWAWSNLDQDAREAAKTIRGQSMERYGVDPTDPRAGDAAVREVLADRGIATDLPKYGGGPVRVSPQDWEALHERAGVPTPEVREVPAERPDAPSVADLRDAVARDPQVALSVLEDQNVRSGLGEPADVTVDVERALADRVPIFALDDYAGHRVAGLDDADALAATREEFVPEKLGDLAHHGVDLQEDPVVREFLERPEVREAYASGYDPASAGGPQGESAARAVDAMVEVLDDGELGRFERVYSEAFEQARERESVPAALDMLAEDIPDSQERRALAGRMAPALGEAFGVALAVEEELAATARAQVELVPTEAGVEVTSTAAAGAVNELLEEAALDGGSAARERARQRQDEAEAAQLMAAADRADGRGEPQREAGLEAQAGVAYDSVQRRQEVASSMEGAADRETIEAWMVADTNQARPASHAVAAEPVQAVKARKAPGHGVGREHNKHIQR